MSIQPAQPQSIGGVLDTTFQLYKASVVKLIPLSLLMALAGSPPSIYMVTSGGGNLQDPFTMLAMMRSSGYLLAAAVSWVATLWMMSAAYLKVAAIGAGSDLGLATALQEALTRLPRILLVTILFGIALVLGTLLLIIPAIILLVSLSLCFATALLADKGAVAALTESHRLVWGNWWRTLVILTVGIIVVSVIYMAVGFVFGAVTPLLVLGGDVDTALLVAIISTLLIGVAASLVITPFYIAMLLAIYWDLKLRKDGGDLAARVGALNPA